MITDARRVPAGSTIEADVCVVGAGPAGITLALELASRSRSVCLLESGGFEEHPEVDALSEGATHSSHHLGDALTEGRRRQVGGTANMWVHRTEPDDGRRHARMLLPQEVDFEQRAHIDPEGWPFPRQALQPYYERAQVVCRLGPCDYEPRSWATDEARPLPEEGRLTSAVSQYCAGDIFSRRYRDDLRSNERATLVCGATAVEIETDSEARSVMRVRASALVGRSFEVAARTFVLAGGGVENARMLLMTDRVRKRGLGNDHGLVGRYLMDHPEFRLGVIEPPSRALFSKLAFYDLRWVDGVMVSGLLTLRPEILRREQLLNLGCLLVAKPKGHGSDAERALKSLLAARRGGGRRGLARQLRALVARPDQTAAALSLRTVRRGGLYTEYRGGWTRAPRAEQRFRVLEVIAASEQAPRPENRVTLSDELDRLGQRKAQIHWRWDEVNLRSIARFTEIFAEEVKRAGLGRFHPWVDLSGPERPTFPGIHHPMGTTRMSSDPAGGVVDEQCRVHGTTNLYVAGSSVFPTGLGYANPTLTIVALAARLAHHLAPGG